MAQLSDARKQELEANRTRGQEMYAGWIDEVLKSEERPLDRLALIAGTLRTPEPKTGTAPPFNFRLFEAIEAAKADAAGWPEIAEALGMGKDRNGPRTARRRHEQRELMLSTHRAEG